MKENTNYIPIFEVLSFLVVARTECINSIILDDFYMRITQLKEQFDFDVLSKLEEKNTTIAFKILSDLGIVSMYPYCHSKEVTLSHPMEQIQIWNKKNSLEVQQSYLTIVRAYRSVEPVDLKFPKVKK